MWPSGKAVCTILMVFGMTQPGLEPVTYRMRGGHVNHYANPRCYLLNEKEALQKEKHIEKWKRGCINAVSMLYQSARDAALSVYTEEKQILEITGGCLISYFQQI